MNWHIIDSVDVWKEAVEQSALRPVAIFKHSTRCSVSFMARKSLESQWHYSEEEIVPYFLDLIAHRSLSNLIAEETGIRHESPQLIVLEDGKPVYNTSHYGIDAASIASYLPHK